ncbi:MAG: ribose 5-phosphate isomerase B [Clostridiales bacterium]|nr:ribose 5-phosphate isomerase B [Clostridiales bacterium]
MIALGSDHAGFALKQEIKKHLDKRGVQYKDFGCYSEESFDYAIAAERACKAVLAGECKAAVLCCGTGIGISMAANKIKGIRAAACTNHYTTKFTRLHNNANCLCLGGRVIGSGIANELVDIFLDTPFEGGRHQRRIDQIAVLENGGSIDSGENA